MISKEKKKIKATYVILEALKFSAAASIILLDELFSARSRSYKSAYSVLYGGRSSIDKDDFYCEENQNFYSLLNKLKREGLIKKTDFKLKRSSVWRITKLGLKKLDIFKNKKPAYEVTTDNKFKIVVFDIPETEKHKREWFREVLRSLDFSMLQRSVWMGKNKIPEQLLFDLKEKRMISYIHILEINRLGSITKLI